MGRTTRLFRLFLAEQSEPERFYRELAADSVSQAARHADLAESVVLDLGGGPGHFTRAFMERGARCVLIDLDLTELRAHGQPPGGAVQADGMRLPIASGAVDVCFSSNVLEHIPDPERMLSEMVRVTRPGGLIYLAFTNWYSPWGGHEMSPWHYLGAAYAQRRYTARMHRPPKNRPGTGLFPVHVGSTLRLVRSRADIELVAALPRYYPRWSRFVLRLPGIREILTWNLLLLLRPVAAAGPAGRTRPDQTPAGLSTATSGSSRS